MAYTERFDFTSGVTLYGKAKPLDTSPWSDGIVTMSENGSTGEYSSTSFVDATSYSVFEQAGGSPASSDVKVGLISPPTDVDALQAELDAISAKTALIGTGTAFISSPVNGVTLVSPLVINDNYLVSLNNAFEFVFVPPPGAVIGSCSCSFGGKHVDRTESWLVTGTLEDLENEDGEWKAIFEMTDTETGALVDGFYNWTAEFDDGTDSKTIARGTRVRWVVRYTDP